MKHHWRLLLAIVVVILVVVIWKRQSVPQEAYAPTINPSEFTNVVDNPYFMLEPGTTFTYESDTADGHEKILVEVTSDTKTIMGVQTVTVHDHAYLDDVLIEDTYDWYAQDALGNVWYFGEDTKEYEDGEVVSTEGSWIGGVDGAQPGVIMWANPQVGQVYRQEYYAGHAEDMGEVVAVNESVKIAISPAAYEGCVKTRDYTPLESQIDEFKWYCPAIGNQVLEVGIYNDERVELTGKTNAIVQ